MSEERKYSGKREKPRKGVLNITDGKDKYFKKNIIYCSRPPNIELEEDFYEETSEEDFNSFEDVTETSSDDIVDPDEFLEDASFHSCETCGSVLSDAQLRSRRILSASEEGFSVSPKSGSSSLVTTSSEEARKTSAESESYILPICDSCDVTVDSCTSDISCPKHGSYQHRQSDQKKKSKETKNSRMYT
ncbi:unnamed protein product [Larinioides sclopetarius]|uniref:Uncharacterized protein n=1 Tax=Larinioides sclopetarius TaxID=280406 RepID=A0AAV2A5A2_9ARAC